MITLYTIGFTKKCAEDFFNLLRNNQVKSLVDVRINNSSQLAGFAKGKDMEFFLKEICNIPYKHIIDFAPTKDLLDKWHKNEVSWSDYTKIYISMLKERNILSKYGIDQFDKSCFLCSEETPENCHRRLLVEYLQEHSTKKAKIVHLL